MRKKFVKVLLCCMALLFGVTLSNAIMVNAKSSEKSISSYASLSYGSVEKVILVSSLDDFKDKIEMGALPLFTPQNKYFDLDFSVTFSEPGYMLFRGTGVYSGAYIKVYRDSSMTTNVLDKSTGNTTSYGFMPVEAGTYYFSVNDLGSLYLGFVPGSEKCSIKGTKQKNGRIYLDITSLDKKAKIKASAVEGTKSAASCYNNNWLEGDYDSTNTDSVASILLPEAGEYTVMIETEYNSDCHNRFVYHIDTIDLTGNSTKLESPISLLAGTNVIVGKAEPGSMIYATYNKADYSVKTDANGVYRLKVKTLKKKKTVKMWQVVNGEKTAEGSFKVMTKY
ncbi:MAG: hypothetical protein K6G24_12070 [Lachnospiraceae bacterium]|nr:hypothetical protein [Lachnospiraceae bacterium]